MTLQLVKNRPWTEKRSRWSRDHWLVVFMKKTRKSLPRGSEDWLRNRSFWVCLYDLQVLIPKMLSSLFFLYHRFFQCCNSFSFYNFPLPVRFLIRFDFGYLSFNQHYHTVNQRLMDLRGLTGKISVMQPLDAVLSYTLNNDQFSSSSRTVRYISVRLKSRFQCLQKEVSFCSNFRWTRISIKRNVQPEDRKHLTSRSIFHQQQVMIVSTSYSARTILLHFRNWS